MYKSRKITFTYCKIIDFVLKQITYNKNPFRKKSMYNINYPRENGHWLESIII